MVSMLKKDMIRYLDDYANIQYLSMHNPKLSVGMIFDRYMKGQGRLSDCNIDYYNRMIRVYVIYSYFRSFSFVEDYLLNRDDFISNNDLNDMEMDAIIYTNRNGITNKQIVQLLRNAFNHNDDEDFERFRISENGKRCEIEFRDIRTNNEKNNGVPVKPFKMKFDLEYLIKVARKINKEKQNVMVASFDIPDDFNILSEDLYSELDKVKVIRYYFPRKLSHDVISQFNSFVDVSGLSTTEIEEKSRGLHDYAREQVHVDGRYDLTHDQKEKIVYMVKWYREHSAFGEKELEENYNFYMYYFLVRVVPIPLFKHELYLKQVIVANDYLLDYDLSYHDITERARNLCNGVIPDYYSDRDIEVHNSLLNGFDTISMKRRFFMDMIDGEFYNIYPIVSYIDAVVTHFCSCDTIEINGILYDKEKIRNSFVHGRWLVSKNHELVLFDADPRNVNDYNLEFVGKIGIELFKRWADEYVVQNNKRRLVK